VLLVGAWRLLRSFSEIDDFMCAAEVWVEYALRHMEVNELDACFGDIAMRFEAASNDNIPEAARSGLTSLAFKVLDDTRYADVSSLLDSANFVRLVDSLDAEGKQSLFRRLLATLLKKKRKVTDMVTLNFYLDGAKAVAASIDRLTAEGTRKEIFRTLVDLVQSIDFGRDFESHLNVLVECRKSFPFIEPVQEALVLQAVRLAVLTNRALKGKTNERASAFIRSCMAFCQITIPSLQGVVLRLNLFTLAAGAALQSGLVGLAEGMMKSAIVLLGESQGAATPATHQVADDSAIVIAVTYMCELLVVLPGHPEFGALYIIEQLVDGVDRCRWRFAFDGKLRCCTALLQLLASLSQARLPSKIGAIDSNDVLFSSEADYQSELAALAKRVFATAVSCAMGDDAKAAIASSKSEETSVLAYAVLRLLTATVTLFHLGQDELLAVEQLYGLATSLLSPDDCVAKRTKRTISRYVKKK